MQADVAQVRVVEGLRPVQADVAQVRVLEGLRPGGKAYARPSATVAAEEGWTAGQSCRPRS